jgi:hypothetical protein
MQPTNLEYVQNLYEWRVYGLRRSGNHAILSWAIDGYPGSVVHLNNIRKFNANPYRSFGQVAVKGISFWNCKPQLFEGLKYVIKRHILKRQEDVALFMHKDSKVNIDYIINFTPKTCLILSYENYRLDDECFIELESNHDLYVGQSQNLLDILILRDPFNLFASLLKSGRMRADNREYIVDLYKQYAREFLGDTQLLKHQKVCINYNKWFTDSAYRSDVAKKLGFSTSKQAYTKVPGIGGGSSFSGQDFNNKGDNMQVLERWKSYITDPFYRDSLNDIELRQLSDQIFGSVVSEW